MTIDVKTLVGDICMTREDGQVVHDAYRTKFDAGERVTLDLAGTRVFLPVFFSTAVGQLLATHSLADVTNRLRFANIPSVAEVSLWTAIKTADRYHTDPRYRTAVDEVLAAEAAQI